MKKIHRAWIHKAAWLLFILYITVLVYFLFFSEHYGRTADYAHSYNLHLFKEIKRFIQYRHVLGMESFIVNIFGNIFAFTPFGFILPIISPKNRRFINVALLSLELTLTIEILQYLLKVGIFDVDDIFLNTVGGVIGYLCYVICRKFAYGKKTGARNGKKR